jgi:hypothetical protein
MIQIMGHFTAIGMRESVTDPQSMVINTCGGNDSSKPGSLFDWKWANPTSRRITHQYHNVEAVSVECLWQGTKIFDPNGHPDPLTLSGDWRRGKAKRPIGAYAGPSAPLITDPGEARRQIYIPAYKRLFEAWQESEEVRQWLEVARAWNGQVYLRDFDTGRGVNRRSPMSHAWVLAMYLNTGEWPTE